MMHVCFYWRHKKYVNLKANDMRIAYIALYLRQGDVRSGVGHKIAYQMQMWQNKQHTAHVFFVTPHHLEFPDSTAFDFSLYEKAGIFRLPRRELSRSHALDRMINSVRDFRPDLIYMRYNIFMFPLQRLFTIAPVVVEVNSDDVSEIRIQGFYSSIFNRISRGIILNNASGLVPISAELAKISSIARFAKPMSVIANGIDLNNYDPLPAPKNECPRLVFVGTAWNPWHGVDKLIWLANRYPNLDIDIVGSDLDRGLDSIPENVHFHGFLNKDQLQTVLSHADVACGTLALHRKNMNEASPLKVREALAYGIPSLLAYQDTDLSNKGFDFLLEIPNQENNVQSFAEPIYDFIWRMKGQRVPHDLVSPWIDQRAKEEKRLEFFRAILGKDRA